MNMKDFFVPLGAMVLVFAIMVGAVYGVNFTYHEFYVESCRKVEAPFKSESHEMIKGTTDDYVLVCKDVRR